MAKVKKQPVSLKKQEEAIEQASKFYNQGNIEQCAQSLMAICSDPVTASLDILTRMILCETPCGVAEVKVITGKKIKALKPEGSYDNHLMLVLIKEITEYPREKFVSFLVKQKVLNAAKQLKEAMSEDVFGQGPVSLQPGYHDEKVVTLGSENKTDSDDE